jgi:hypothetical protein
VNRILDALTLSGVALTRPGPEGLANYYYLLGESDDHLQGDLAFQIVAFPRQFAEAPQNDLASHIIDGAHSTFDEPSLIMGFPWMFDETPHPAFVSRRCAMSDVLWKSKGCQCFCQKGFIVVDRPGEVPSVLALPLPPKALEANSHQCILNALDLIPYLQRVS